MEVDVSHSCVVLVPHPHLNLLVLSRYRYSLGPCVSRRGSSEVSSNMCWVSVLGVCVEAGWSVGWWMLYLCVGWFVGMLCRSPHESSSSIRYVYNIRRAYAG